MNKEKKIIKCFDIFILIVFFITALSWALSIEGQTAPDEDMRYLVIKYIYNYGKLPLPNDPEVVDANWGASYAYFPLLLNPIICALLMRIIGIFSIGEKGLLMIARFVSVLCGTGFVFCLIKISNRLFENKKTRYFAIILGAFIPQLIYLSSYVNNDSIALLSTGIIAYCWVWAMQDGWNIKNSLLLSLGIIICALAYYNAYAWILMTMFFFILSYIYKNDKKTVFDYKNFLKYGFMIAGVVLIGISFFFIRSYIVNNGDLLGSKAFSKASEENAIEPLKPSKRLKGNNNEQTCTEMLFAPMILGNNWIRETFYSFVCVLGSMSFHLDRGYYVFHMLLFIVGLLVMIPTFWTKTRKDLKMKLFYLCLFICGIVPIALSIYNSYVADYQPQRKIYLSNVDFFNYIYSNRNSNNI